MIGCFIKLKNTVQNMGTVNIFNNYSYRPRKSASFKVPVPGSLYTGILDNKSCSDGIFTKNFMLCWFVRISVSVNVDNPVSKTR